MFTLRGEGGLLKTRNIRNTYRVVGVANRGCTLPYLQHLPRGRSCKSGGFTLLPFATPAVS